MRNMTGIIALFAAPASGLSSRLADLLAGRDAPARILHLDAPLRGEPVTVRGDRVTWQGFPLDEAAVLWIERPVFPWPQMLPPPFPLPDVENFHRWRGYQREARALAASALAVAAERATAVNPPASAHLAVAPVTALDALAAGGFPVAPWRVGPAREPAELHCCSLDPVGRDLWHPAGRRPPDAMRLVFPDLAGPVIEMLVVGPDVVGHRRWIDAAAWPEGGPDTVGPAALAGPAGLAVRAASALALETARVVCTDADPGARLLLVDAAPDWEEWDVRLGGAPASFLARRLASLARENQGATA